jgi:hypothetical protein
VNIGAFSIVGTGNAFSTAGGSSNVSGLSTSATLTVPAGGGTIGFGFLTGGAGASFTNLTSDSVDTTCCGPRVLAAGHDTALSGSNTFTITFTAGNNVVSGSFATFSP